MNLQFRVSSHIHVNNSKNGKNESINSWPFPIPYTHVYSHISSPFFVTSQITTTTSKTIFYGPIIKDFQIFSRTVNKQTPFWPRHAQTECSDWERQSPKILLTKLEWDCSMAVVLLYLQEDGICHCDRKSSR